MSTKNISGNKTIELLKHELNLQWELKTGVLVIFKYKDHKMHIDTHG